MGKPKLSKIEGDLKECEKDCDYKYSSDSQYNYTTDYHIEYGYTDDYNDDQASAYTDDQTSADYLRVDCRKRCYDLDFKSLMRLKCPEG